MTRARKARRRLRKQLDYIRWTVYAFFVIAILVALGELPQGILPIALEWGVALVTALILSWIVGHLLAALTGDLFERKIRLWKLSVPLFPIITIAIKIWLFGI